MKKMMISLLAFAMTIFFMVACSLTWGINEGWKGMLAIILYYECLKQVKEFFKKE